MMGCNGEKGEGEKGEGGEGRGGVGEFCLLLLSSGLASLYLIGIYIGVHVYVFVVLSYHAHQECTQHTNAPIMDDIVGVCVNVWGMFACMKTCNCACMNTWA